jgi:hypothetical protein
MSVYWEATLHSSEASVIRELKMGVGSFFKTLVKLKNSHNTPMEAQG